MLGRIIHGHDEVELRPTGEPDLARGVWCSIMPSHGLRSRLRRCAALRRPAQQARRRSCVLTQA